jgi:hypothetical protein
MRISKEEKAMWLEDWRRSGKKAWTYAKENGLIPQTFCGWVRRELPAPVGFVELPAQRVLSTQTTQELVIEKADVKIRIPLCLNANEFRIVMEGLRVALW